VGCKRTNAEGVRKNVVPTPKVGCKRTNAEGVRELQPRVGDNPGFEKGKTFER
jgi:hypothetical protein